MLTHLKLKNGSSQQQVPLELDLEASITIFVGPNNSGKSQALREIGNYCMDGSVPEHIINSLTFALNDESAAKSTLTSIKTSCRPQEKLNDQHIMVSMGNTRQQLHEPSFIQIFQNPNSNLSWFAQSYFRHFVLRLDGASRMQLLQPQQKGDLKYPQNTFARLFTDDTKRANLRQKVFEATGLYVAMDISVGAELQLRFSTEEPVNERSLEQTTIDYMSRAKDIEQVSDGVKAYTGILLQVYAGDPKVILIDEPEAFLHPALAYRLGRELATGAAGQNKQVFISTHSPHFVMGAVTAGAKVNIIRLTYDGTTGTARLLPNTELAKLMQDPMLRSIGVISGLFFNHVIICEGDTDRSFYQEINERLYESGDSRGVSNALFLNAQNKQTIPRILEPLRRLGIPAAAIVDIDVVKDGGIEWTRFLTACGIPQPDHEAYQSRRKKIFEALNTKNEEFKRNGGISLLVGEELKAAEAFIEDLAKYGLFIVARGEVEGWLSNLDIPRGKKSWLDSIFEKMGSDPKAENFIKPNNGDVWDFIGYNSEWLRNPRRRGIND